MKTGRNSTPADVDPEQLAEGIRAESEHTDDPATACAIALDHLAEHPRYYTMLDVAEADETLRERGALRHPLVLLALGVGILWWLRG